MFNADSENKMKAISEIPEEKIVSIVRIEGGWSLRKRVTGLGFVKGENVKVIKNEFDGPMMVEVKGSKFALGRGEAEKIFVG